MSDIKLTILQSIDKYTNNLQYLAQENPSIVKSLTLLLIVDEIFD